MKEQTKKQNNKKEKVEKVKKVNRRKKKEKKKNNPKFFKGVRTEMANVTWPSKKNMIKYSLATIEFIIFFAIYFFLITTIFAYIRTVLV